MNCLSIAVILLLVSANTYSQSREVNDIAISKKTFTYKTSDKVQIMADLYRTDNTTPKPVIIWIHGGASETVCPKNKRSFISRQDIPWCQSTTG